MSSWPNDVLLLIVETLSQDLLEFSDAESITLVRRTVGAMAISNRALRSLALPALYKKVEMNSIARIQALQELISRNPFLVSSTEALFIRGKQDAYRTRPDCAISDYLTQPECGSVLFARFPSLKILGLSHLALEASHIRHCVSYVPNITELKLSACLIPAISLILDMLGTLPVLKAFHLSVQPHNPVQPGDMVMPQHGAFANYPKLDSLSMFTIFIMPPPVSDYTLHLCDAIARAGFIDRLHTLTFDLRLAGPERIPALRQLLHISAQSLESLTLSCRTFSPEMTSHQFPMLYKLGKLRLNGGGHKAAADLLRALARAAPNVSEVILGSVQLHSGAVKKHAVPLWEAIEELRNLSSVQINASQYDGTQRGQDLETEQGVRDMLPLTDARGVLSVSLRVIR